jgi:hypothetical protein
MLAASCDHAQATSQNRWPDKRRGRGPAAYPSEIGRHLGLQAFTKVR